MHAKGHAITNVDWALRFTVFSPIIGVLLGAGRFHPHALKGRHHEHDTFFKSPR